MESDWVRVGVVGGVRLPGNVRTFLTNLQRLLTDSQTAFELELVVRGGVDVPAGYDPIDPGFDDPDRAIGTLRTLIRGLTAYAESHSPDVLFQVTKFPLHGCAVTIAGRRTGTPVLTRFAGDNFREFQFSSGVSKLRAFGLNNVLGRVPVLWSDRVMVLGPYGRSQIERRYNGIPIEEIPQPVDREKFSPVSPERERALAQKFGFSDDEHVLLSIGRLTERKGMDAIIETAETLSRRSVDFRWCVLGDGPMRAKLKATPGIEPLGRVNFDEIPDYYRAVDLVVHPSYIEGLSNVLLEAAACGTPTVSRDVGDCATAATTTFEENAALPTLVTQDHGPVDLGARFQPDTLCEQYASALVDTARNQT